MLMDAILIFDQVKRLITAVAYGDLVAVAVWRRAGNPLWHADLRGRMDAPLPAVVPLHGPER